MSEWGFNFAELHLEGREDFIFYWYDIYNGESSGYFAKKLRAFCFLEGINLDVSDDELFQLQINSHLNGKYICFSTYNNLSKSEISLINQTTNAKVWENFALINKLKLAQNREELRILLGPTIEKRNIKHQFFLEWGFRKFW